MDFQSVLPALWLTGSIFHFVFYSVAPLDPSVPDAWYIFTTLSNYLNLAASLVCAWMGCKGILFNFMEHCFFIGVLVLLFSIALTLCTLGNYFLFLRSDEIAAANSLFWGTTIFYLWFALALFLRIVLAFCLFSCSYIQAVRDYFFSFYLVVQTLASFCLSLSLCYAKDSLTGTNYYLTFWSFSSSAILVYNFFLTHKENDTVSTLLMLQKLKRVLHCFIHVYVFQGPVLFVFVLLSEPALFHSNNKLALLYMIQMAIACPCLLEGSLSAIKRESPVLQTTSTLRDLLKHHFEYISDSLFIESLLLLAYLYSHFQRKLDFFSSGVLSAWASLYGPILLIQFTFTFLMRETISKQEHITPFFLNMVNSLRISADEAAILIWSFWAKLWGLFTSDLSQDQRGLFSFAIMALCVILVKIGFWAVRYRSNFSNIPLPLNQFLEGLLEQQNVEEEPIAQEVNLERIISHLEEVNISQVSERDCAICLEGLKEGKPLSRLVDCNHIFHSDCIFRWVKTKESCPLDRIPLN